MKLSDITPHLIYSFKSERELISAIEEISQKFTTNREKIGDYLKDPRLVSAYAAFYLLTNIPKLSAVLKWLPALWVEELKKCDFVDLGAGPGTYSFAWKELGGLGDFYQVELSNLMQEQAKKIWEGLSFSGLFQSKNWEWKTSRPKFLFFGHSANEMSLDAIISFIEKIDPEHILFIEPGTQAFFPKMLEIRDYLLKEKFNVLYPCSLEINCPMKDTTDWCHQFIQVKQDEEVERLSQMAKLDRKLLPMTVHAYSKTFKKQNSPERVVRVLPETKFSFEWEVCHLNALEHYQVMKRDLSKDEVKRLSSLLSGEAIETELIKEVGQNRRVKLIKIL